MGFEFEPRAERPTPAQGAARPQRRDARQAAPQARRRRGKSAQGRHARAQRPRQRRNLAKAAARSRNNPRLTMSKRQLRRRGCARPSAFASMKLRRGSTWSPISVEKISSAVIASSICVFSSRRVVGIHRRFPQLLGIHLAQALVALGAHAALDFAEHPFDRFAEVLDRVHAARRASRTRLRRAGRGCTCAVRLICA